MAEFRIFFCVAALLLHGGNGIAPTDCQHFTVRTVPFTTSVGFTSSSIPYIFPFLHTNNTTDDAGIMRGVPAATELNGSETVFTRSGVLRLEEWTASMIPDRRFDCLFPVCLRGFWCGSETVVARSGVLRLEVRTGSKIYPIQFMRTSISPVPVHLHRDVFCVHVNVYPKRAFMPIRLCNVISPLSWSSMQWSVFGRRLPFTEDVWFSHAEYVNGLSCIDEVPRVPSLYDAAPMLLRGHDLRCNPEYMPPFWSSPPSGVHIYTPTIEPHLTAFSDLFGVAMLEPPPCEEHKPDQTCQCFYEDAEFMRMPNYFSDISYALVGVFQASCTLDQLADVEDMHTLVHTLGPIIIGFLLQETRWRKPPTPPVTNEARRKAQVGEIMIVATLAAALTRG